MKKLLIIALLLAGAGASAQNNERQETIHRLEAELRTFNSPQEAYDKMETARELLALDNLNYDAVRYIADAYSRTGRKDSVKIFFDDFAKRHPESALPYLYRARLGSYETDDKNILISYLKKGYDIDPANDELIYLLGKSYYDLFRLGYGSANTGTLRDFADTSISHLEKVASTDEFGGYVSAPLLQLYNFTDNEDGRRKQEAGLASGYFPALTFTAVPADWRTNYSVDMFEAGEGSLSRIEWYSRHYSALGEAAMSVDGPSGEVVRFLWLRTFDNPVLIRVDRTGDEATVTWKRTDGQGGYDPGKMIVERTEKLTHAQWTYLKMLLEDEKFWSLATVDDKIKGFDGTQYVLEAAMDGKHHAVDRWGGYDIGRICLFLFALTDIDPKQEYDNRIREWLEKRFENSPDKEALVNEEMERSNNLAGRQAYDLMLPGRAEEHLQRQAARDRRMEGDVAVND